LSGPKGGILYGRTLDGNKEETTEGRRVRGQPTGGKETRGGNKTATLLDVLVVGDAKETKGRWGL